MVDPVLLDLIARYDERHQDFVKQFIANLSSSRKWKMYRREGDWIDGTRKVLAGQQEGNEANCWLVAPPHIICVAMLWWYTVLRWSLLAGLGSSTNFRH